MNLQCKYSSLKTICIFLAVLFSQAVPQNAGSSADSGLRADTLRKDTALSDSGAKKEKPAEKSGYSHGHNPFAMGGRDIDQDTKEINKPSGFFISFSRGLAFSKAGVKPGNIEASGSYSFISTGAVEYSFNPFVRAGIGLEFIQLDFTMDYNELSSVDSSGQASIRNKIETAEHLRYLTLPVSVTLRPDFKRFVPFAGAGIIPAFFVSGDYFTLEKVKVKYKDESTMSYSKTRDVDITQDRERFSLFCGAVAGIEYHYGYGSFFARGGFVYNIIPPGNSKSYPFRDKLELYYFPVSIGLKISL